MERIEPAPQTVIYNMTYMRAFLLRYRFLCGMTGTAASAAQAFRRLYGLSVCAVPPHRPCIRQDEPDAVFPDAQSRDGALLRRLRAENARGRPVLVGTGSVRESEALSARLSAEGLDHSVLNAREDAREAAVIAQAGRPGRITISTNMAGRGVDIRLGGADGAAEQAVRAACGLLVLGTALNRSRRLDDQLRGRAGRQGDPGGSRFYLAAPEGGDGARALRRQQREAERQDTKRATFWSGTRRCSRSAGRWFRHTAKRCSAAGRLRRWCAAMRPRCTARSAPRTERPPWKRPSGSSHFIF